MNFTRAAIIATLATLSLAACTTADIQSTESSDTMTKAVSAVQSAASFQDTRDQLKAAIEKRGLTIMAEIDHAAGARSAELELAESTLFIFGNPKAGTLLMKANPQLGLDLPLKALVYSENGEVFVLVSDIRAVTTRAEISEPAPVISKIEGVLAALVQEATEAPAS